MLDADDGPAAGHRAREDSRRVRAELVDVPVHVLPGTWRPAWRSGRRSCGAARGLTKDAAAYGRAAQAARSSPPPVLARLLVELRGDPLTP